MSISAALRDVLPDIIPIRFGPGSRCGRPVSLFDGKFRACNTAALTFPLAADFFEQLDLDLLNLEEPIVLAPQQVIDFFV
jgi:hypothetical protein